MKMEVYVSTYAKYNNGNLFGEWLDLSDYQDKEEFYVACRELHEDEEDPEFMFQDWEGVPDGMIGESWIEEELFELAKLDDYDFELLMDYREYSGYSGATLRDAEEAKVCRVEDWSDYAATLADEMLYGVPGVVKNYFDYGKWERDLSFDYGEGEKYVYYNN